MSVDTTALTTECKSTLFPFLFIRVVDEDLRPDSTNTIFASKHSNWLATPAPKITTINSLGVETLRFTPADYTINFSTGTVTFVLATTDLIRAEYNYFPFTDAQLIDLTKHSLQEISTLIYRPIDENDIPQDYRMPICKRLYTNTLKTLLLEAKDFFQVSVGGRVINKTNIVPQINAIIEQNEEPLKDEINILRTFNKTNRILATFSSTKTLDSKAKIV